MRGASEFRFSATSCRPGPRVAGNSVQGRDRGRGGVGGRAEEFEGDALVAKLEPGGRGPGRRAEAGCHTPGRVRRRGVRPGHASRGRYRGGDDSTARRSRLRCTLPARFAHTVGGERIVTGRFGPRLFRSLGSPMGGAVRISPVALLSGTVGDRRQGTGWQWRSGGSRGGGCGNSVWSLRRWC